MESQVIPPNLKREYHGYILVKNPILTNHELRNSNSTNHVSSNSKLANAINVHLFILSKNKSVD